MGLRRRGEDLPEPVLGYRLFFPAKPELTRADQPKSPNAPLFVDVAHGVTAGVNRPPTRLCRFRRFQPGAFAATVRCYWMYPSERSSSICSYSASRLREFFGVSR